MEKSGPPPQAQAQAQSSVAAGYDVVCTVCGNRFKRSEHLARHMLSHNGSKPHSCPTCQRAFARRDTLLRHISIHWTTGGLSTRMVDRVSKACSNCARLRLKCDGKSPCARCSNKAVDCKYTAKAKSRISTIKEHQQQQREEEEQQMRPGHFNGSESEEDNPQIRQSHLSDQSIDPGLRSDGIVPATQGALPPHDQQPAIPAHTRSHEGGLDALSRAAMNMNHLSTADSTYSAHSFPSSSTTVPLHQHGLPPVGTMTRENRPSISDGSLLLHAQPTAVPYHNGAMLGSEYPTPADLSGPYVAQSSASFPGEDHMNGAPGTDRSLSATTTFGFDAPWEYNFNLFDWMLSADAVGFGGVMANPYPFENFHETPSSYGGPDVQTYGAFQPRMSTPIIAHKHDPVGIVGPLYQTPRSSSSHVTPEAETPSIPGPAGEEISSMSSRACIQHDNAKAPPPLPPLEADIPLSFPDLGMVPVEIIEAESFDHVEPLSLHTYDEIKRCLKRCDVDQQHFHRFKTAILPPIEAFDCFVQLYFEHFHPIFPILHKPTFDPSKAPWQLVLAVATTGSRYSRLSAGGKCATALQELLRRAIANTIEGDKSPVREIWLIQASIIHGIGMSHGGSARHMEMNEGSRNKVPTYCRRNGAFRRTKSPPGQPQNGDGDGPGDQEHTGSQFVEERWRRWIHEESHRRSGLYCFLTDAQLVLYYDCAPMMAPEEIMQQQLPCNEALWDAPDAHSWADVMTHIQTGPNTAVPTIGAAVTDICEENMALPAFLGDFARLVLVFTIYRCASAVRNMSKNPLRPRPDHFIDEDVLARAVAGLEVLAADFLDTPRGTLMQTSVVCHVFFTLMILYSPREHLISRLHVKGSDDRHGTSATQKVEAWIASGNGRTARLAVANAARLLAMMRDRSCQAFYEPMMILASVGTLSTYSELTETECGNSQPTTSSDRARYLGDRREREPMVRLDLTVKSPAFIAWLDGGSNIKGHIKDVGNVNRSGASSRILDVGLQAIQQRRTWGLGMCFAMIIEGWQRRREMVARTLPQSRDSVVLMSSWR